MKLIIGLGNPGRVYAKNRHNIGFVCLNHFARQHGIRFNKKQAKARIGNGEVAGYTVMVARPQTYMNLSGQAVSRLVNKFKINFNDLIVIHDDLDLSLGKIRIRQGGSSGGHKGVDSIFSELGSQELIRIRVGIGRPILSEDILATSEADIVDFVLGDFTPEEKQSIKPAMTKVSDAIICLLVEGLETAMNIYN